MILPGLSPTIQFVANLGVGLSKLIGELVSAAVVDRLGRRTLTIGGNFLLSCSIVGIALSFQYNVSEVVQIAMLCSIMFTFSLGPG